MAQSGLALGSDTVAPDGDRAQQAVAALYDVAKWILASLDMDEVLLSVANAASRLLHSEIAGIFLLDADAERLEMRCVVGHRSAKTAKLRPTAGQGLAGKTLLTGKPERVDEYSTSTAISDDFLTIAAEEETRSAMCAPMRAHGDLIGVLCVWRRRPSTFDAHDEQLLVAFAELATIAVHKARLYEAQKLAAEKLRETYEELTRRLQAAEYTIRIHDELTKLAAGGEEVDAVVGAVERLTGDVAFLVDDDDRLVAGSPEPSALAAAIRAAEGDEDRTGATTRTVASRAGDHHWLVAPVRAGEVPLGRLFLRTDGTPDVERRLAAEQAATVCALLLGREEAAFAAGARLRSEFVWDLVEGRVASQSEALLRAHHLGHDLHLPARVILVAANGLSELARTRGWTLEEHERNRHWMCDRLAQKLADATGARPAVGQRGDLFAAIVARPAAPFPDDAHRIGHVAALASPFPQMRWTVGLSGYADAVADLPEALRQAQLALRAVAPPDSPVVVFDELGVLQFLLAPTDGTRLRRFARQVVGTLQDYDRSHRTDLVATLRAYLTHDCVVQDAADSLCVHPKTVRYRLQRIQELTPLRLQREEHRFNAHLALMILQLDEHAPDPA